MNPNFEFEDLNYRIEDGKRARRDRNALIKALADKGWSQRRIASSAGLTQQAVSKILSRIKNF